MYSIIKMLKEKIQKKDIENYEVVIVLLTLAKANHITENQISDLLMKIFEGDIKTILQAVYTASYIADDPLLDEIISETTNLN